MSDELGSKPSSIAYERRPLGYRHASELDEPVEAPRPIFGFQLSSLSKSEIIGTLIDDVQSFSNPRMIVTMNLDHVVNLRRNADFRKAYSAAYLVTADGAPIYLYARLHGLPLRGRVTGADLFAGIVPRFGSSHRPFLLANRAESAERTLAKLEVNGISTSGFKFVVPPFGFETDIALSNSLVREIQDHRTTHLFVCVGSPKSEIWVWQNRSSFGGMYILCVGAGLDFFAGTIKRAPLPLQRSGLEWLWRLLLEPRRLFRRYAIDSWGFINAVKDDLANRT